MMKIDSALVGVLIGGCISLASSYLIEVYKFNMTSRALALSFKGEIGALISIVETRKYIELLSESLDNLKITRQFQFFIFEAHREYFSVYKANSNKIGMLRGDLPQKIVEFYTSANAVLEDMDSVSKQLYAFLQTNPSAISTPVLINNTEQFNRICAFYDEFLCLMIKTFNLAKEIIKDIDLSYS